MARLKVILGENQSEVELEGGKKIVLKPLTLNDVCQAEEYFGCDMDSWDKAIRKFKNVLYLVYLSLKRSEPALSLSDVGDLFDMGDLAPEGSLTKIVEVVLSISGLRANPKNLEGTVVS